MDIEDKYANAAKSPQPFVVTEPEKLNTLGVRYHGINSNYQKYFDAKRDGKRESLKPPSLFKDLNLQLIKHSNYKETFSPRTNEVRTSRTGRLKEEKYPVVHHLSSSFIPLDSIQMDSELAKSSYKKEYSNEKTDVLKYFCPHGNKSSNGAISKY
jgi:hypothetical protein